MSGRSGRRAAGTGLLPLLLVSLLVLWCDAELAPSALAEAVELGSMAHADDGVLELLQADEHVSPYRMVPGAHAHPSSTLRLADHLAHVSAITEEGLSHEERHRRSMHYVRRIAGSFAHEDLSAHTPLSLTDHIAFLAELDKEHTPRMQRENALMMYSAHLGRDYAAFLQTGSQTDARAGVRAQTRFLNPLLMLELFIALMQGVTDYVFGEATFFNMKMCTRHVKRYVAQSEHAAELRKSWDELQEVFSSDQPDSTSPADVFETAFVSPVNGVYEYDAGMLVTPLWFTYDSRQEGWLWTPYEPDAESDDRSLFQPVGELKVRTGRFAGQEPAKENVALLRWLHTVNPPEPDLTLPRVAHALGDADSDGVFTVSMSTGLFSAVKYFYRWGVSKEEGSGEDKETAPSGAWQWSRDKKVWNSIREWENSVESSKAPGARCNVHNHRIITFLRMHAHVLPAHIAAERRLRLLGKPVGGVYTYRAGLLSSSIMYRYNAEGKHWEWSPDNEVWMSVARDTAQGGKFDGRKPVDAQLEMIHMLHAGNPEPPSRKMQALFDNRDWFNPSKWLQWFDTFKRVLANTAGSFFRLVQHGSSQFFTCMSTISDRCLDVPANATASTDDDTAGAVAEPHAWQGGREGRGGRTRDQGSVSGEGSADEVTVSPHELGDVPTETLDDGDAEMVAMLEGGVSIASLLGKQGTQYQPLSVVDDALALLEVDSSEVSREQVERMFTSLLEMDIAEWAGNGAPMEGGDGDDAVDAHEWMVHEMNAVTSLLETEELTPGEEEMFTSLLEVDEEFFGWFDDDDDDDEAKEAKDGNGATEEEEEEETPAVEEEPEEDITVEVQQPVGEGGEGAPATSAQTPTTSTDGAGECDPWDDCSGWEGESMTGDDSVAEDVAPTGTMSTAPIDEQAANPAATYAGYDTTTPPTDAPAPAPEAEVVSSEYAALKYTDDEEAMCAELRKDLEAATFHVKLGGGLILGINGAIWAGGKMYNSPRVREWATKLAAKAAALKNLATGTAAYQKAAAALRATRQAFLNSPVGKKLATFAAKGAARLAAMGVAGKSWASAGWKLSSGAMRAVFARIMRTRILGAVLRGIGKFIVKVAAKIGPTGGMYLAFMLFNVVFNWGKINHSLDTIDKIKEDRKGELTSDDRWEIWRLWGLVVCRVLW